MWAQLTGENLTETKEMRILFVEFFRAHPEAGLYLLNRFFRWKGQLLGDKDIHLHNAGEEFMDFLRGRDPESFVDPAFEAELRGALDVPAKVELPSGQSEGWHDSTGRQKRTKKNG